MTSTVPAPALEMVEYSGADPVRACPQDGRALRDHRGPVVICRGQVFGEPTCAVLHAKEWPDKPPAAVRPSPGPHTVPVLVTTCGAVFLPGDVIDQPVQSATTGRWHNAGSVFRPRRPA